MSRHERAIFAGRLAFDARYVRDSYGGIARFAFCLLSALARSEERPTLLVYYDPAQVATRFPLAEVLALPNVVARPIGLPLYSPQEQLTWPALLRRDHASIYYSPYFALPLAARLPLVNTVHDLIFEMERGYERGRWVRYYYRPMMRLALRRAAAVLSVSEATKTGLASYYGLAAARVAVVGEAAAEAFRFPLDETILSETRRRLGLPEPYVLAIGARRPHKNLGAAVRAFAAVQPQIPHWLVVVGRAEPRYPDEVAAALAEVGAGVRVRELAAVDEADLPAVYAAADALLMPSLHEGFGLPALEAMASGTPVVASRCAALAEVVGEAGLLVDVGRPGALAEALRRVALDARLREDLRRRGLARAAQFSWERSAATALAVFADVAARGRHSRVPS